MAGNDRPIVIKKIKKGGHGGHHGGAWKVAYADFVTAMMAFFLLMWLINTTTPEQKRGIADYFAPDSVSRSESGTGALLGGTSASADGQKGEGTLTLQTQTRPPSPSKDAEEDSKTASGAASPSTEQQALQNKALDQAAARLRQAMQDQPDLAELSKHVLIDETPEGVRIQLIDQDARSMFEPGNAEPTPRAQRLLQEVEKVASNLPNRISIAGHTDGASFSGPGGYSNWDLSSARANASLKVLTGAGLNEDRVFEVTGKAGSEPLYPDNPIASANRRISIVLLREAPVLPPAD
ncbi:MAG: OmpA family protein [Alphaproteobacteria bacterium]|nr:OmpA family protein [Alphaproteobacteria bacterium]